MRRSFAALAALTVLATPALPVRAQNVAVVSASAYTYLPGDADTPDATLTMQAGSTLIFVGLDPLGAHTVTAAAVDENLDPLFDTPPLAMGEHAEVTGAERLPPGRYDFYCVVHNPVMQGELVVTAG